MSRQLLEQVSKEKLVEALMAERKEKEDLKELLDTLSSKGKKASEKSMDDLQGSFAKVCAEQVEYKEPVVTYDAEGNAVETGVEQYSASPALLGVIERFLKTNSIITDISTNENTKTLKDAMSRKARRSDNTTRLPQGEKIVDLLQQDG
jgi:hypothetical protein